MTDDELIETMAKAAWEVCDGYSPWEHLDEISKDCCRKEAKAALAIAEPEIRRRVLLDVMRWQDTQTEYGVFTYDVREYARERGIEVEP